MQQKQDAETGYKFVLQAAERSALSVKISLYQQRRMDMKHKRIVFTAALAALLLVFFTMNVAGEAFAASKDVPRMSKEELRGQLNNPDVVVIDARSGRDWRASEFRIKGAKRENPEDVSWAAKYPKEKTIVIYCA